MLPDRILGTHRGLVGTVHDLEAFVMASSLLAELQQVLCLDLEQTALNRRGTTQPPYQTGQS
jgi:hypothetical protein